MPVRLKTKPSDLNKDDYDRSIAGTTGLAALITELNS
jgi:hypothetical protein